MLFDAHVPWRGIGAIRLTLPSLILPRASRSLSLCRSASPDQSIHPNKIQSNYIVIHNIKLALSLVAVLSLSASAFAGDQENIQGTWKGVAVSLDGKALPVADVSMFLREIL